MHTNVAKSFDQERPKMLAPLLGIAVHRFGKHIHRGKFQLVIAVLHGKSKHFKGNKNTRNR